MDTIHHAKALVREGAYMFTVDLTDAFNGIPLHPKYYKYFRFRLGNQHYQFKVLFLYFFIHCCFYKLIIIFRGYALDSQQHRGFSQRC